MIRVKFEKDNVFIKDQDVCLTSHRAKPGQKQACTTTNDVYDLLFTSDLQNQVILRFTIFILNICLLEREGGA